MPAAILGSRLKDANDTRTYSVDWTAWLASLPGGDTIATSVFTIPAGLTLVAQSNTTTQANIRLSGGTAGTIYVVANTVTTAGGEIKRVVFRVIV